MNHNHISGSWFKAAVFESMLGKNARFFVTIQQISMKKLL